MIGYLSLMFCRTFGLTQADLGGVKTCGVTGERYVCVVVFPKK